MISASPRPASFVRPLDRRGHRRRVRAAALMALTALLITTPAFGRAEQWIEVKSPNVTVVSSAGGGSARSVAWQMEQVRSAIKTLWPWAKVDLDRPLTVLAVDDENGMRALAPAFWEKRGGVRPSSVWVAAPDHYFLAIRTDLQQDDTYNNNPHASAYFMYVSLILDQSLDVELPEWLSRGLAGVLSNTVVQSSKVLVGNLLKEHLQLLSERTRLKIPALMKVAQPSPELNTSDGLQRFDAESWAFVHFLMFGNQGARAAGLNQFFKLLGNGTDADTAFREIFGKPELLEDEFSRYKTQQIFSYQQLNVDVAVKRERFAQRALPPSESASIRALLHVAMGRPVEARAAIAEALKAGGAAPEDGTVEGLILDRERKPEEAAAAFARAVAEGSKSAHAHYRLARVRWVRGAEKGTLQEVEKLLAQAITLNPRHAYAYASLAEVRSVLGNTASLGLAIRAVQLDPLEMSHRLAVTRILMREKRYDDALKAVQAAAQLAKTPEQSAAARDLQQVIEREVAAERVRRAASAPR